MEKKKTLKTGPLIIRFVCQVCGPSASKYGYVCRNTGEQSNDNAEGPQCSSALLELNTRDWCISGQIQNSREPNQSRGIMWNHANVRSYQCYEVVIHLYSIIKD